MDCIWPFWPNVYFLHLIGRVIVCYTAVFSVVGHRYLSQTAAERFRAVSQLEFSFHFLEGVRATFAARWFLQSQLCFYRCPYMTQNNQNRRVKTRNQLEWGCRSQNLWDKQLQQQSSRANVMHSIDVLIKLPGIASRNRSWIIYKIGFVCISTFESLVFTCTATQWMSTSGTWNSSYICTLQRTNLSW